MSEVQLIARHTMKPGTQLVPLLSQRTIDEFDVPAQTS